MNSGRPSSSSRPRICRLTAGWDIRRNSAPRLYLPNSATPWKQRRRRTSRPAAQGAQQRSHIRLGLAVILMTSNNPFAIAERVAPLDVLSNGRVEFGMGRGSTHYMVEAFGVDRETERARAVEATG